MGDARISDPLALVMAAMDSLRGNYGRHDRLHAQPEIQAILDAPDDLRRRCVVIAACQQDWEGTRLLAHIARRRAGLTLADVEAVLPPLRRLMDPQQAYRAGQRMHELMSQVEATWAALDADGRERLRPQLARVAAETEDASTRTRLRKLIDTGSEVPYDLIEDTDEVGKALRVVLTASPESPEVRTAVIRLLSGFPATGKPGKKWTADARSVLEKIAEPVVLAGALLDAAIGAPDFHYSRGQYTGTHYVSQGNEALLCAVPVLAGMVARGADGGAELLARLRKLALKAITFIGDYGSPRSIRLANQCVQAIGDAALPSSVTELLRVERGTRHGALLRQVRKAIDALAAAQGLGRDELLERVVEDHGLAGDGTRCVALDDGWTAVLEASARAASVSYLDVDGKPRKSLSAPVRHACADALAALQKELKAVRATIGNERSRTDQLLAAGRLWPAASWRELYLDHPVTGRLARALIWSFTTPEGASVTGIPVDKSTLVARDGEQASIPADAEVRLWHPVTADAAEVAGWRQLLLDRQIVQPVKQAFREVYVLTPAELETRDYSNRFAGHLFRQVPARALMKGRGWSAVPLAWWDDGIYHGVARREYERAGIRAEFFFDDAGSTDVSGEMYTFVASDQVRFFHSATGDVVPLAQVPPLVLSEAMRDVDLFIGVTSIGNDPEWLDRGEGRRFGDDYWRRWSFGTLSTGAEVRREVLSRLMPMLAIASRCTLEDRYLVVRGDLRTYRIHLGSSNILMSPNDQYLCIVAGRDARADKLFLPFDDDPVLSMILSKAFLLAADANITDESITRQIRRGI